MAHIRKINKNEDNISVVFDKPTTHVQSEGEILIANLAKKQTNTETNLYEQLANQKEFVSSQELTQLKDFESGQSSLPQFKVRSEYLNQIEDLRYYGLSSIQIELYLDYQKGEEYMKLKHKNISKTILDLQLKEIHEQIERKKSEIVNISEKNVPRQIKELGLSVKPESDETKLFNFALSNNTKKEDSVPLNHPINSLKEIESELFSYLDRDSVPCLAKRRKHMKRLDNSEIYCDNMPEINLKKGISKWDIKDSEILKIESNCSKTGKESKPYVINYLDKHKKFENKDKVYKCQRPNYYTIKNDKIIKLKSSSIEDVEKQSVNENKRLTEEEIKLNPKFKNYDKGKPCSVLYIKNIAKSAKEEFLCLFDNFNSNNEKPEIKLMTGKMQGQAFVTFTTEDLATDALNKYNGCILKEKPIVIAYGKSQ